VPVTNGYRDFNYGSTVISTPTGEKPESKLWCNDGLWWGSLWDPGSNTYTIHSFDKLTQSWTSTGTAIDNRSSSKADALWDGQKLYIASHIFDKTPEPTESPGQLYRYSYNSTSKIYTLDFAFPVNVNGVKTETLVLAKDSSGQLWVTWTEGGNVKVNRSLSDDLTWGQPFILPGGTNLDADDISSIIAFDQNKIGVMWSNQNERRMYFAVHLDSDPDDVWQSKEFALFDPNLGGVADDHINLKLNSDDGGTVYAATKTSLTGPEAPLIYLLKRTPAGSWSASVFGKVKDGHTRPILLVDSENNRVYVFAMSDIDGTDAIYMKSSDTENIIFPAGAGTPFIKSSMDLKVNNPTSTKQCVNDTTGLLVLAGDQDTHYYLHNYIDIATEKPSITSFTPASGVIGIEVTITGSKFTGTTAVGFNGTAATTFTEVSDTEIRAIVPSGATTGKISVTNATGTRMSTSDFAVEVRLQAKIFLEGPYDTSTHEMSTALNDAGYIPIASPYAEDPRTVASIPANITDWVLVQLRNTPDGSAVISKSAFLRKDGRIVADDGATSEISFDIEESSYYVVIKHRNHLKVMSSAAQTLDTESSSLYDFSTGSEQYYGSNAKLLETGAFGTYSGDTDASGTVDANDRSATWNYRNNNGYNSSDCDLSGTVDANDRSVTWNNRNVSTGMP